MIFKSVAFLFNSIKMKQWKDIADVWRWGTKYSCTSLCVVAYIGNLLLWDPDAYLMFWEAV